MKIMHLKKNEKRCIPDFDHRHFDSARHLVVGIIKRQYPTTCQRIFPKHTEQYRWSKVERLRLLTSARKSSHSATTT